MQNIKFFFRNGLAYVFLIIILSKVLLHSYSTPFVLNIYQILWFIVFFLGVQAFYIKSTQWNERLFIRSLIYSGIAIRVTSVFGYYAMFEYFNGVPFQAIDSDQMFYNEWGQELSDYILRGNLFPRTHFPGDFSDFGYPYILSLIYSVFGDNIVIARLIQTIVSTAIIYLSYKISKNFFSIQVSRLAAIIIALYPTFVRYSAIHLKETFFVFVVLLTLYQSVIFVQNNKRRLTSFGIIVLGVFAVFGFRTISALIVMGTFLTYLVFNPNQKSVIVRYATIPIFGFLMYTILLSSPATEDFDGAVNKGTGYSTAVLNTSKSKNLGAISSLPINMALSVLAPYPNLTGNLEEEKSRMFFQQLISVDSFLKGILGFPFLLGLWYALRRKFKQNIFLLSFVGMNFLMLSYTGVMLNLRHYLPVLPILIIFASVGIVNLNYKQKRMYFVYLFMLGSLTIVFNVLKLYDYNIFI